MICDISCVQFVVKGVLVPIPYIKKAPIFCICCTKNVLGKSSWFCLFVWEFVSEWK